MPDVDVDCCVVGAGFAGLTAARRLRQAGQRVAVLEARDRVGGRTWTEVLDDDTVIERGGAWVGPGQDGINGLIDEMGVATYKQYVAGENLMVIEGKAHRYEGTVPLTLSPWVTVNLGVAFMAIDEMAKRIPLDAPWEAEGAHDLDAQSLGSWLSMPTNVSSATARDLLATALGGIYTSDPDELSMLWVLFQLGSGGGPSFFLGTEGAAEDARPVGGMGAVSGPMAAELGGALHLSQPVRRIVQDDGGVTIRTESLAVRAARVVVAVPPAIANRITYEPMLPVDRAQLMQRSPFGAVQKVAAVYDQPFWRGDGLTGESAATHSPVPITIDACGPSGSPGILNAFVVGAAAREMTTMPADERRRVVLREIVGRFGDRAGTPTDYIEQDWTAEPYTVGGMLCHLPPGVLTQFGRAIARPCGRIHWAGTETSPAMYGSIDGAVRSGERVAREVIEAEAGLVGAGAASGRLVA